MRRTARALSVAVLAGAALVIAGPAASADPTPGASSGTVQPGGTPSVSVPCDALAGLVPDTTDAAPPASADGSAQCDEGQGQGQGRGLGQGETPGLVPGEREEPGVGQWQEPGATQGERQDSGAGQETGQGQWQEPGAAQGTTGSGQGQGQGREEGQGQGQGQRPDQGRECQGGTRTCSDGSAQCREPGQCHGDDSDGQKCAAARSCTDDHQCEDSHGDFHGDSHGAADDGDCGQATGGHGVEAGAGGSFSDSVPALVAGGVLIATACAGAGYRLCGRRRSMDG
ncbi:hypothetical protein [Streptomyces sp. Ag109_G2-15]|uniref:hypothetical protein n=1 Tax=Streptomyces sp. Ag109_G2-15 TaxID=1938850 RepID=UPI000BD8CD78|nr:hypothetical protein [Streptomyces sp. Ag109_G2-15]SOE08047.1 hypothetical protein SAMN06272765_8975 [Streptomyces sp. Ag109_G2-15]